MSTGTSIIPKFLKRNNGNPNPKEDQALKALVTIMVFGVFAIACISFWGDIKASWRTAGLSLTYGLMAALCGGVLGFLFGIPRSLQQGTEESTSANNNNGKKEVSYGDNTNLEQISDWLTKIIVGVSLTQLPSIERRFHNLCTSMAKGFKGSLEPDFAYPYVAALLIFFAICGFLMVYLWAKIYLLQQLFSMRRNLDRFNQLDSRVEQQSLKLEIDKKEKQVSDFFKQRNRLFVTENKPEFKDIVEKAKPAPIIYHEDGQKARWGGNNEMNGYVLTASFPNQENNKEHHLDASYEVRLTVEAKDGSTLQGDVYFFLHDSYFPYCIEKVQAQDNKAVFELNAYEAFTVGAVCNDGAIKLELDLNNCSDAPEGFKYTTPSKTIDELQQELAGLQAKAEQ